MKRRRIYSALFVLLALLGVIAVGIQQNAKYDSATKAMVYITNEGYGGNGSIYDVKKDSFVIVTTYHLLQDSKEVMVYFPSQTIVLGTVLGVIEKHHAGIGEIECCGLGMEELIPNTVDASGEKHIPVVEVKDGIVKVHVGSIDHPMVEEHWIEWIYLETDQGSQVKYLKANEAPEVEFVLGKEKPLVVYAYCNLHGLWKTDI